MTLTITQNGVDKVATVNASGVISGNGLTGTLNHTTGVGDLVFSSSIMDSTTLLRAAYQRIDPDGGDPLRLTGSFTAGLGHTEPDAPLVPGSVSALAPIEASGGLSGGMARLTDDGAGNLVLLAGEVVGSYSARGRPARAAGNTTLGSVDYATGEITINTAATAEIAVSEWRYTQWLPHTILVGLSPTGVVTYSAERADASTLELNETDEFEPDVVVDLTRTVDNTIVPGSICFDFAGKNYIDRNGVLYADVSTQTGAGITAGAVDYTTGRCTLTYWAQQIEPPALLIRSCLTAYGDWSANYAVFRTAGFPVRVGSLLIQVTATDGTLISASSGETGEMTGAFVLGDIDYLSGVVQLAFGEMVTAAGNEGEPWFDADAVVGGMIWRPMDVMPGTLRYSCVVLSNLPLSADILGLDPVRLPSDGRVPIYRPADVMLLRHTGTAVLGTPAPGATVSMGRDKLADIWMEDADGDRLPGTLYTSSLAAGTVTIAADAVFAGYTMPVTARHTIEEILLATDVQINGQITVSRPVGRVFPVGSLLSSAVLFGDLYARVTGVFDQQTWTGVWSDTRIGDQAAAQYDDINFPIEVLNEGAIPDRGRLNFLTTTTFQVISENMGVIGTGNTSVDTVVNNPLTGKPYWRIRQAGFNAGWVPGNQLRWRTYGAIAPIWLTRTVLPGATLEGDSFSSQLRGDVD